MKKILFGMAAVCASSTSAQGQESWSDALGADVKAPFDAPEHRAFDFWIGDSEAEWRGRPQGEFYHADEGSWMRHRVFPVLDGKALIELAWARDNPEDPSQRGFSIRYLDEANDRWVMAQNWPNAQGTGSAFTDQLVGKEYLGRLTMYSQTWRPDGDGGFDSQHRRYNFTDVREASFRWDGSNTTDRGNTWTTWMVVDFHRNPALEAYGAAGTSWPGVHEESLCTDDPHGAFDLLEGVWRGEGATMSAGKVVDGCGVAALLDDGETKTLFLIGYLSRLERWVMYRLDNQPGTPHSYYVSKEAGAGAVFEEAPNLTIKNEFDPYITDDSADTSAATRRYVWEVLGDDGVTLREEVKGASDRAWDRVWEYELTK